MAIRIKDFDNYKTNEEFFDKYFFSNGGDQYAYYSDMDEENIVYGVRAIINKRILKELSYFKYQDLSPAHGKPYTKTIALSKKEKEMLTELCKKCFVYADTNEIDCIDEETVDKEAIWKNEIEVRNKLVALVEKNNLKTLKHCFLLRELGA